MRDGRSPSRPPRQPSCRLVATPRASRPAPPWTPTAVEGQPTPRHRPGVRRQTEGVVTAIPYAPATGVTSRFTAVADAYASRTREHRNFGTSPALRTTARPRLVRSYLASPSPASPATSPRPGCGCTPPRQAEPATPSARSQPGAGPRARSPMPRHWRQEGSSPPPVRSRPTPGRARRRPPPRRSGRRRRPRPAPLDERDDQHHPRAGTFPGVRLRNPGAPVRGISAWNRPIPANAPLAANSAGMVRRLSSGGHYNVTNGAWGQMGAPVFYADASTPRYTWGRALRRDQRQAGTDPARLARGPGAGREHRPQVQRTAPVRTAYGLDRARWSAARS
jgi:hypothetical protein